MNSPDTTCAMMCPEVQLRSADTVRLEKDATVAERQAATVHLSQREKER